MAAVESKEGPAAAPAAAASTTGFKRNGAAELRTRRLVLKRLTPENGDSIYITAWRDAAHLSVISAVTERIKTAELRKEYIDQQLRQWEDKTRYQYVVYERETSEEVGMMCLFHPAHDPEICEVGYFVLKDKCRRGYGAELLTEAVRASFVDLGMHRVVLRISHMNLASQGLAKKVGFQLDGVLREDYLDPTGTLHSTHLFSLLKHDKVARAICADSS